MLSGSGSVPPVDRWMMSCWSPGRRDKIPLSFVAGVLHYVSDPLRSRSHDDRWLVLTRIYAENKRQPPFVVTHAFLLL